MTLARVLVTVAAALLVMAASPPQGLTLQATPAAPMFSSAAPSPPTVPAPGGFTPAPLPNRDIDRPTAPNSHKGPTLAPSLFSRKDTYRGEGFSAGSTVSSDEDKRAKPAAGFNLTMPFSPN